MHTHEAGQVRVTSKYLGLAGVLVLAGVASSPVCAQQTASERADLARYERYAEPPIDQVHFFRIDGFEYLAPDRVAVWFGVNQMYLLTVQQPCNNLAFANAIGLTARDGMLHARFDAVTFRHQRCQITAITPVNELQMKRDAAHAAKASG